MERALRRIGVDEEQGGGKKGGKVTRGCFSRDWRVELHLELVLEVLELVLEVLETEEDWEVDETILLSFFVFFICATKLCRSTIKLFMVLFDTIFDMWLVGPVVLN